MSIFNTNKAGFVVCKAFNSRTLDIDNTITNQRTALSSFSIGRERSDHDNAVELTEDEEGHWHSIQPLGMHSEDFPRYENALYIFGLQSVNQLVV
jgi:hypothetical protein